MEGGLLSWRGKDLPAKSAETGLKRINGLAGICKTAGGLPRSPTVRFPERSVSALHKPFPPKETWNFEHAYREVVAAAEWARQAGYLNVAPRLEWAARLLKEEINKRERELAERQQQDTP